MLPQAAFRLPRQSEQVLILDKVMITSSPPKSVKTDGDELKVVSAHHAEILVDQVKSVEPILQAFCLSSNERILGFRRGRRRSGHTMSPEDTR